VTSPVILTLLTTLTIWPIWRGDRSMLVPKCSWRWADDDRSAYWRIIIAFKKLSLELLTMCLPRGLCTDDDGKRSFDDDDVDFDDIWYLTIRKGSWRYDGCFDQVGDEYTRYSWRYGRCRIFRGNRCEAVIRRLSSISGILSVLSAVERRAHNLLDVMSQSSNQGTTRVRTGSKECDDWMIVESD